MKNKKIREYQPQKEDIFIFDTNILIDLFYPMNMENDLSDITGLYSRICKQHAKIIISSIQISEFINRCIRFQFGVYSINHSECKDYKKDYRGTEDYNQAMKAILEIIKNEWIDRFIFVNDQLQNMDISSILNYTFSFDFNDALIVEIAKQEGAILVTNDGDYSNYDLPTTILTNNYFLLNLR